MAETNKHTQIGVKVVADTSDLQRVEEGMQAVGAAGQQAGQQASTGLDKIGASAEQVQRKFENSIKKAMELNQALAAGPRGSSGFIEARAAQMGADVEKLRPMLAELRALEEAQKRANVALNSGAASLNTLGMSAKATTFALRQVPAQMTDIVTSLAAGQAPLQVLIQQGGQLKDLFGGIGPAARALGGYMLSLVNPLTITAAAIAGIGYAALQGSKELREFQNATTLTGNAIGISASQFGKLRDEIAGIAGTKGKAAEALTEIAKSGISAGDNIKGIAEAAVLMEKSTGQSIEKTVAQFKKLADEPSKASAELSRETNFLTTAVYEQIKALEEQGKKAEAAALAMRTLADTTKDRAAAVVDNAGSIERAWRGVLGVLKQVVDATASIGRTQSIGEQLTDVRGQIAKAQRPFDASAFGGNAEARANLDALRQREAALQEMLRLEQRGADAAAERIRIQAEGNAAVDALSLIHI